MRTRPIRLAHPTAIQSLEPENVYFTFASGRLDYDCVSCGSKCCRGHGYLASVERELAVQFQKRPTLPIFTVRESPDAKFATVANLAPGCFFLREDGLCDVHVESGASAKPETCRLFPFNFFRRFGAHLIAGPHLDLCPLRIVAPGMLSERSTHETLLDSMESSGITNAIPEVFAGGESMSAALGRELAIRMASEIRIGSGDVQGFLDDQLRIAADSESTLEKERESLAATGRYARDLLGLPARASQATARPLDITFIGTAPHIRSMTTFQPKTLPKGRQVPLDRARLAHQLQLLHLLAEAAQSAGMQTITYQTLTMVQREFAALIEVLARADCVMVWLKESPIELDGIPDPASRQAMLRVARALLPAVARSRSVPLGQILLENAPADPLHRVSLLRSVASRLAGRITTLTHAQSATVASSSRERFVRGVQRLALDALSEESLLRNYDRLATLGKS